MQIAGAKLPVGNPQQPLLIRLKRPSRAQVPRIGNEENKVAAESKPSELESQVAAVKAENAAFREAHRNMEEQQKALFEMGRPSTAQA